MSEEPNYLAAAFKSQYNLIGLGTAIGFAVLSGSALPLLVAAGVEMVVLPLVSGSARFQRLVKAQASEEAKEEQESRRHLQSSELLRAVSERDRIHYRELEGLAAEIRRNYAGFDSSSRMLLEDLERKLDFLLSFYLRMRHALTRYDAYFQSTDPERIQERISMLEHEMSTAPARVRQIKERTRGVLQKRLERYEKAIENRHVMEAQAETVLEVLQLLRDQSYSMRDPRTITEQLDGLVSSAEETERGVRDLEDVLSLDGDALLLPSGLSLDAAEEAEIRAELERGAREAPPKAPAAATSAPRPAPAPRKTVGAHPAPPPPPGRKKITH